LCAAHKTCAFRRAARFSERRFLRICPRWLRWTAPSPSRARSISISSPSGCRCRRFVSILHRVSGALLFLIGIPLLLWIVQRALASPDALGADARTLRTRSRSSC
jgi:hypothetical protein